MGKTMNYYEYNFISADPLFAKIELELKSYFSTGMLDNLLFPIWTKYCLDRLGKGSFPIQPSILIIENYECKLPPDFISVREARMCVDNPGFTYKLPSYFYKASTYRVSDDYTPLEKCAPCDPCNICDKTVSVVYKTMYETITPSYRTTHLLKPGNLSCFEKCDTHSPNLYSKSEDTFDIKGNKFFTNFSSGTVYLLYYSSELDEEGTNLIPDNPKIQDYIEKYIKYKLFEQLSNQVTDETYAQIERKCAKYDQEAAGAFLAADSESKKHTDNKRIEQMKKTLSRHDKYNIK